MIDQWFNKDLQSIFNKHSVLVFIDESKEADFLLKTTNTQYTIYTVDSDIEELHIKYLIEGDQDSSKKHLIYTNQKKEDLTFIREYCETNGCIEIRYLQNYIKDKVHQYLNLNINLSKEDLISAAKISLGNDQTYWMDLSHKGATEIFDLEKELLPFINAPLIYSKEKFDDDLLENFYLKVNDVLEQEYISKPPETLAYEVVKKILDGLVHNKCTPMLENIYYNWLDSVSTKNSFADYLARYLSYSPLPSDLDIWFVHPSHPFRQIDEQWLREIGSIVSNNSNKGSLVNYINTIKQRNQNKQALALDITFWEDVIVLLEFDPKDIDYLSSFKECIDFYTKHFYKLDTAIRNLYTEFLNQPDLLQPFQEHYKQFVSIFFDKWFSYFYDNDGYQEEQTGILQDIINTNSNNKIAVIVGDGVAFEMANQVSKRVNSSFKLTEKVLIADIPSETENNMSRIYMDNGVTEKVQNKREKYLKGQNPNTEIDFIKIDAVNEDAGVAQVLICTYKDIDDMGEKLQHKALKYFPETINFFADKINLLLNNGYSKVYLITDHGFVLTGLLSESDKISVTLGGIAEKAERYIRSEDKQSLLPQQHIEVEKKNNTSGIDYNYLYFSKTMNPFKTPGVYGFAHGGVAPQELITPYFCWQHSDSSSEALKVEIFNKEDLKSVTGQLYQLKLKAENDSNNIFKMDRKVYLVFFSNKEQINTSDIFTIKKDEMVSKEYSFDSVSNKNVEIEVHLLDAHTKEQLDRVTIKQNNDRDLGGLF